MIKTLFPTFSNIPALTVASSCLKISVCATVHGLVEPFAILVEPKLWLSLNYGCLFGITSVGSSYSIILVPSPTVSLPIDSVIEVGLGTASAVLTAFAPAWPAAHSCQGKLFCGRTT